MLNTDILLTESYDVDQPDKLKIKLDKIGSYQLSIFFEPFIVNNIQYNIDSYHKFFNVLKHTVTATINNDIIKLLINTSDSLPLYYRLGNRFYLLSKN